MLGTVANWGVAPHPRGRVALQLQLMHALWGCELLVVRSSHFRDSGMHFLCEIA